MKGKVVDKISDVKDRLKNRVERRDELKKYIFESSESFEDIFARAIEGLSTQQYGPLLQTKIFQQLNIVSVPASKNKGDGNSTIGVVEVKAGAVNNEVIKLFQCRPYQKIDWYLTVHYCAEHDEMFWMLIPGDSIKELINFKGSSMHGAGEHGNQEYAVTFSPYKSERFVDGKRWAKIKRYRKTFEELKEICKN